MSSKSPRLLNEFGKNANLLGKFIAAAAAAKSLQSFPTARPHKTAAHQALPSLGFSRQEHWSGLPFPSPCMKVKSESEVTQSCPTLQDPVDCSPPGSSVHGIFQARVLEWVAISFSIPLLEGGKIIGIIIILLAIIYIGIIVKARRHSHF